MKPLYYESHITIEPVFDERLEKFKAFCQTWDFKAADLLMQKEREATPERSNKDTFATGKGSDYDFLQAKMHGLLGDLMKNKFKVWRYKIEAILLDQKLDRNEGYIVTYDGVKWNPEENAFMYGGSNEGD